MLSEEQFFQIIKEKTGKEIGNFGFIAGTHYPIGNLKNMTSARLINGFIVWKKEEGKTIELILNPSNQEESLEQIINFLNAPVV